MLDACSSKALTLLAVSALPCAIMVHLQLLTSIQTSKDPRAWPGRWTSDILDIIDVIEVIQVCKVLTLGWQ